jgi:hypothetical protein
MTFSQTDVALRIELAATSWCWVAAESDGKRALYRLVKPGERVVLEGQNVISVRLGNAGSVTLSINVVRAKEGWIVHDFDLDRAAQVNRPCDTSKRPGNSP